MASYISDHKSLCVGAGVSLLTSIAGVYSNYFRAHPAWLVAGGVLGGGLLMWPLLHTLLVRSKNPDATAPNPGVQAGRDNAGHQFSAGRDVYIGVPPALPVKELPTVHPSSPNLRTNQVDARNIEFLPANLQHNRWSPREGGRNCVAIPIYNPPAEVGSTGSNLYGLIAHQVFRVSGSVAATVSKAYWMEYVSNEIDLRIGEEALLLLGTVDKFLWVAMSNYFKIPKSYRSGLVIPSPGEAVIDISKGLEIEVSLILSSTGTTVGRFYVDVLREGAELKISKRADA